MILSTKKMTFDKKIRNQRSAKIQIPDREIEEKTMGPQFPRHNVPNTHFWVKNSTFANLTNNFDFSFLKPISKLSCLFFAHIFYYSKDFPLGEKESKSTHCGNDPIFALKYI